MLVGRVLYGKKASKVDGSNFPSEFYVILNGFLVRFFPFSIKSVCIDLNRTAFDLRTRHTIYAVVFGGFAQWLKSNAISQNMIQRYLALPTLRDAKM